MNDLIMKLLRLDKTIEVRIHKAEEAHYIVDIYDCWEKDGVALRGVAGHGRTPQLALDALIKNIQGKRLVINPTSESNRKEIFICST